MPRAPDDGVGGALGPGARARGIRPLSTRARWLTLGVASLVCFALAEGAVRVVGEFGPDGQFIFRDRVIRPRVLPIRSAGETLERYLTSSDSTFVYHRVLGWIPRPSSRSADGLYAYDEHGIARSRVAVPDPTPTTPCASRSSVIRSPTVTRCPTGTPSRRCSRPG